MIAKNHIVLLLAALLAGPAAFAHTNGGPYGTPKPYCENLKGDTNVHDYSTEAGTAALYILFGFVDGNLEDCDGDGAPGDSDGHSEYATGGAFLLAKDPEATFCYGEAAHHPPFPFVWVFDHLWPSDVLFQVGADVFNVAGGPCGDGVDDVNMYCVDHCAVPFPPGLDGAYHVYVVNEAFLGDGSIHLSALGHVYT